VRCDEAVDHDSDSGCGDAGLSNSSSSDDAADCCKHSASDADDVGL